MGCRFTQGSQTACRVMATATAKLRRHMVQGTNRGPCFSLHGQGLCFSLHETGAVFLIVMHTQVAFGQPSLFTQTNEDDPVRKAWRKVGPALCVATAEQHTAQVGGIPACQLHTFRAVTTGFRHAVV
jgi:hypothetical protein